MEDGRGDLWDDWVKEQVLSFALETLKSYVCECFFSCQFPLVVQ